VRDALAKIATQDADRQLRELASKPLGPAEKAVDPSTLPPRLGVMTDYVKAAPGVAPELVGKLAVMRMSSGSPADHAGFKEADILLEINGTPITSGPQLLEVLDALSRNVDVGVLVSRNGQTLRLTARF
jgi:S1-C subfamily serine protease